MEKIELIKQKLELIKKFTPEMMVMIKDHLELFDKHIKLLSFDSGDSSAVPRSLFLTNLCPALILSLIAPMGLKSGSEFEGKKAIQLFCNMVAERSISAYEEMMKEKDNPK